MKVSRTIAVLSLATLVACAAPSQNASAPPAEPLPKVTRTGGPQSAADFRAVVRRVEPVAERACRSARPDLNCDFKITLLNRPDLPPNAFQTYEKDGTPLLAFTPALLRQMKNRDELAMALSHEAAHHIEGHIVQTQSQAQAGALVGLALGSLIGLDAQGVDTATNIGATVGARRYSKRFELQADSLGARISQRAGYDPLRGILYFQDAADPGDRFLGTHPPNGDRIRTVRAALAR